VFQAPEHREAIWRVAAKASQRPVLGVLGPHEQVTPTVSELEIEPETRQLDETEFLYRLPLDNLQVPASLRSGRLRARRLAPSDAELYFRWMVEYAIEALSETDGPELRTRTRSSVERSIKAGRTWVVESRDQPVSCSGFNAEIREAVQIGGVWTPPELRGRGYGRAAVAASLLDARQEGVAVGILFTGKGNLPARKAYEALGFQIAGEYRLVLLKTPIAA
jgi:predicted GNAT family acetyltransferase